MELDTVQGHWCWMEQHMVKNSAEIGAHNLLAGCARAKPGERLLILWESPDLGYFDADLAPCIADTARAMGLRVISVEVPFMPEAPALSADLRRRIADADITLFLARLGDQLRFCDAMPGGRVIVCFAVTTGLLGSAFGTASHDAFNALKGLVNTALSGARQVRVTCPMGTDFFGTPDMGEMADTAVLRFPVSVFAPVPGAAFSGVVALPGFLAGTGSRYYDDYLVRFDGPVVAQFRAGRLVGFDGSSGDVARASRHYDTIAARYGIDRNMVHSWHAGIHPGCGFGWDGLTQMERWSGVAFGNPRLLHLHTCGADAPGEISWNVIDPTITLDGVALWQDGVFHPSRIAGGAELMADNPEVARLFQNPDRRIGLPAIGALQTA